MNIDSFGRKIDYLRISVTDRCNLRCRYCMPEDIPLCSMSEILSYEEITEAAKAAAKCGIRHLKITGGEPLVRKGCVELIRTLKHIPGIETVTLTTNGTLLKPMLPGLKEAGTDGINISLDTLIRDRFQEITGSDSLCSVLEAIKSACASGIPVKINTAVMNGMNTDETEALAALAEKLPLSVRFIEMMPIGFGKNCGSYDNMLILKRLITKYPDLHRISERQGYGPAVYYGTDRLMGKIGFISAVHGKFCRSCNRLRLTSEGMLKYCLCYEDGIDLRAVLRNGKNARALSIEQELISAFARAIQKKPDAHCFETPEMISETHEMSRIGG